MSGWMRLERELRQKTDRIFRECKSSGRNAVEVPKVRAPL